MITNVTFLPKDPPVPPLVKIREVAKLLSVSRHTVHNLIESGDLTARPINPSKSRNKVTGGRTHVRITRESLFRFYQGRFGHPLKRALAHPFDA